MSSSTVSDAITHFFWVIARGSTLPSLLRSYVTMNSNSIYMYSLFYSIWGLGFGVGGLEFGAEVWLER